MSLPYDCGCLKPKAERYLDSRYRSLARTFVARELSYGLGAELAAFLDIVPPASARWIFMGKKLWLREARLVHAHFLDNNMVQANRAALDVNVGIRVLRGMQEGGWTNGVLPDVVHDAIAQLRHEGLSRPEVAKMLGLTVEQVNAPRKATVSAGWKLAIG